MSDDDDDDDNDIEDVIDESLLVTNVTAESLGYTAPVRIEPDLGPSTSSIISNLPSASMELTLQYLSGTRFVKDSSTLKFFI